MIEERSVKIDGNFHSISYGFWRIGSREFRDVIRCHGHFVFIPFINLNRDIPELNTLASKERLVFDTCNETVDRSVFLVCGVMTVILIIPVWSNKTLGIQDKHVGGIREIVCHSVKHLETVVLPYRQDFLESRIGQYETCRRLFDEVGSLVNFKNDQILEIRIIEIYTVLDFFRKGTIDTQRLERWSRLYLYQGCTRIHHILYIEYHVIFLERLDKILYHKVELSWFGQFLGIQISLFDIIRTQQPRFSIRNNGRSKSKQSLLHYEILIINISICIIVEELACNRILKEFVSQPNLTVVDV